MIKYIDVLKKCPLFYNIKEDNIEAMLSCLSSYTQFYNKGQYIWESGDMISAVGILLTGKLYIIKEDFWGNRTIMSQISPGELVGESFSCSDRNKITIDVVASEPSDVMFIDYKKITTTCSSSCYFHNTVIQNMITGIAEKNISLTRKIEHITKRTTRDKLLSYLYEQSTISNSKDFTIPFNRQELADYLAVERSAMSNELSKMQHEGLITYNRNHFTLTHEN